MILSVPQRDKTGREGWAAAWRQLVIVSAIALMGIAPLVVFAVYAHETFSAAVLAGGERGRLAAARVTAGLLTEGFARVAAELEDEASDPDNPEPFERADRAELGGELENFLLHFPLAVAAGAFDADGQMIASRGDSRFLEGFPGAFLSSETSASSLQIAHRPNGATSDSIVLAMAVRGGGDDPKGTFAIALDPTRLLQEVTSWMGTPERGLVLIDEAGRVVTAIAPSIATRQPEAGDEVFAATAALDAPAWSVRAVEPRASALAYRDELLLRLDLASGAATLSVFVLGWLRTRTHFRMRRHERALQQRASRQAALLEAQSDLGEMLLVEENGRLTAWNLAAIEMTGMGGAELAEIESLDDLFLSAGEDLRRLGHGASIEIQLRHGMEPGPWVELARQPLPDEGGSLVIGRDITQRRALQRELEERATHDRVTGLPNRTLLEDRIAHALAAMRRRGGSFSVIVLDLDLFKSVNDTLGHHAGDQLLVEVGRRVKGALREQDTVARLGGDEIAVLMDETDAAGAETVARKIAEAMRPTFIIEGREVRMSASVGIAVAPTDGEDADALLRRADLAMYEAKKQRGSHRFYATELEERMLAEVRVATELRRALDEGQLELYYQPKISARTQKVAGIEALVRWVHPTRGVLTPEHFVPQAVRARLGIELDAWVLRHALVAARTWQRMGLAVPVSVNVGAHTVDDPGFVELVRSSLRSTGVNAESLVLELTEDATLSDPRRVGEILRNLTAEGVGVSIDDFGTGYSSLLSVQHLPASELKIDRAFVRNVRSTPSDQKIVRAATALARSLDMTATAEGVEDTETWELLQQLGCAQGQGYLFSRPLPMPELITWLLERPSEMDEGAIQRYADRLLQLAERDGAPDSPEGKARLRDEREGIRAVLAWALRAHEVELALTLAASLRRHWCDAGRLEEASHWLGSALAAASESDAASPEATIDALNGLGVVTGQQGDLEAARSLLQGCVEAARAIGADRHLARALMDLGVASFAVGDLDGAERCGTEAAWLLGRSGQRAAQATQWNNIAVIRLRQGHLSHARDLVKRAAATLDELGHQRSLADVLDTLGAVALAQNDTTNAWRAYARSLLLYRDHGVAGDVAQPLLGIGVLVHPTRADLALQLIGAAEAIGERFGSKPSLLADRIGELVAGLTATMGETASADEMLRGRGLETDDAVSLALSCVPEESRRSTWSPGVPGLVAALGARSERAISGAIV